MYYKIISCDFAKIKCGNTTFPLVIAHLDLNDTYANGYDFVNDLLRISNGMITISSVSYRGNEAIPKNKLNENMIAESATIGNEIGFKIIKSAQKTGEYSGILDCQLFYNNNRIAYGESSYGWNESYDLSPIFVFCDAEYNVLQLTQRLCSINVRYLGYAPLEYTYGIDLDFEIDELIVWGEPTANVLANIEDSIEIYSIDPYSEGGNTGPSVMTGDFDDESDPIDFPSLPTLSAVDTGLITLYNPSLAEIVDLANYMWTNPAFDISAWKKIFADPIDAILGLSIVPVAVPDGGVRPIAVGNLLTDVSMNVAAQQYIEVQCGALNVNEFWSSYLDYDPYTKAEIYLPYCGVHQLSVDDIMNKTIEVRYHIDILSGACCAYVKCGSSVLYQFIGQCSSSIPVASGDFSEIVNSALNAALAIGSAIATSGAGVPLATAMYTAGAAGAAASAAVNIQKEKIQKSGSLSGTGGMLAIQKPYLILTRPRQAHPENQSHYTGYPSFITEKLSTLSGYTEIESIHLENVPATDAELTEIETLLKGGVIL